MAKKNGSALSKWHTQALIGGVCEKCNKYISILTVDHIVPIYFLDSFDDTGRAKYEDADNFQFLCHPCNSIKAGSFDRTNPKTINLILKYIKL